MDLDDFVDLSGEVIYDVEEAAVCSYEDLADLSSLLAARFCVLDHLEGACRVVKDLSSSSVVERYELTGQKVALDLEESYVFTTTSDEACVDNLVEFEADQVEIAELTSQELHLLESHEVLERVDKDELSTLEILAINR